MHNVLTVDVEEWYHVCGATLPFRVPERRVVGAMERMLELFASWQVKATFFMLGSVAEREQGLVPLIAAHGHEIASHGYSHRLVTELDASSFRDELRRTADIILAQGGAQPIGYRAPQWSLSEKTPWAFDILVEEGYLYDSSLSPLPFVGNRRGSRVPYRIDRLGGSLVEFPPMVTSSPMVNLPTGGGWGFRFFPFRRILKTVEELNTKGNPAVFFLHPRELDPEGPRLPLNPFKKFVAYGSRQDAWPRLERLLSSCSFLPLAELVVPWQSA
jgi:polysaccharide deacetylase family protein (PEP-CTERM system associated)